MLPGSLDRIRDVVAQAADGAVARAATARPIAVGWATVELDRAAFELARDLNVVEGSFQSVAGSVTLGARCRVAHAILPGGLSLALLEPETEGRLAATLARWDEGPAAVWLASEDPVAAWDAVRVAAIGLSSLQPGPFGDERLVLDGPLRGLHWFLVGARAGYHPRMTDQATISLRPAEAGDAEAIATLFTDEGYPAGPSDIRTRLERFAPPNGWVLVAEHDGAILGFIAIHAIPRFEHDDRIVRIIALVVDAGARERGVGRSLMAEAERIGTEIGAAFIELTAGHHRPEARQLYESLGYDSSVTAYLRKKL